MTSTPSNLEILYFKLTSGVDILAMLSSETSKTVIITHPIQLQRVMNHNENKLTLGLIPWVPVVELLPLLYTLKKSDISAMVEVPQSGAIINEYRRLIASLTASDDETIDVEEVYDEDFEEEDDEDDEEQEIVLINKGRVIH